MWRWRPRGRRSPGGSTTRAGRRRAGRRRLGQHHRPAAMQALPVGVPKLMVSTLAGGDTRDYVGGVDIR